MNFPRASGVLLHPTSLPGDFGIGDLGAEAYKFVDFLYDSGQTYWQILPLAPPGDGDSPYSAYSAFAGNTLLISPELLVDDGLTADVDIKSAPEFSSAKVEFSKIREWKRLILAKAFEKFRSTSGPSLHGEFEFFTRENFWWLDDYAVFCAMKASHEGQAWFQWAAPLKARAEGALSIVRSQLAREIAAEKFYQFLFFRQWHALKRYANRCGVQMIGDAPIFVALDSADVWCNQNKFKLNADGSPKFVAGVPPDYFSETGQLWGNPIYDWEAMLRDNFGWWTARIAFALQTVDVLRLDHFIGFARNWEVPGGDETAENGHWRDVPGREFFTIIRQRLGKLAIIAEDLGSLTPEVEHLRDAFGIPGMHILQYAFGGDARNRDLPHNYVRNCVVYTGTHDNDTTLGWFKAADKNVRSHCREYLQTRGRKIHWDMIRAVFASVADTAIVPMQDVLGLGSEHRMNRPATESGNWTWRMPPDSISHDLTARLKDLTVLFGRNLRSE